MISDFIGVCILFSTVVYDDQKGRRDNIEPVSYTHLDVYKRQLLYSIGLCTLRGMKTRVIMYYT